MPSSGSPPLSPPSSTTTTTYPHLATIPTLPHTIVGAAHCLAPLDDLHLAHLVNEIKPPPPTWSICDGPPDYGPGPCVESNDRLRADELADLPAPEAERLHAAYDIEDHLDCTPDRLLVYGPSTPLTEVLEEIKTILVSKKSTQAAKLLTGTRPPISSAPKTRYNRESEVYVARLWIQPKDGPGGCYKWDKGGADLIRFELDRGSSTADDGVVINWSPVEVALSQALEVGHQLLALLHSRHFAQLLGPQSFTPGVQLRAIDPIIWLVDPVEYAHAQLRETTEWGWSEHHVDLKSPNTPASAAATCAALYPNTSSITRDIARPLSRSHLSQEIYPTMVDEPTESFPALARKHSDNSAHGQQLPPKPVVNQADDLPNWLDDLLDRRLPRLLALPGGCLSYELLHLTQPTSVANRHITVPTNLIAKASSPFEGMGTPSEHVHTPLEAAPLTPRWLNPKWPAHSAFVSPSRALPAALISLANSVPSFDQNYIHSPGSFNADQRHGQTNTLRYYPCMACAEHAFKLALSHKLDEEKRRLPRAPTVKRASSSLRQKAGSGCGSDAGAEHSTGTYQAIGLGSKGKAVKEAMDREDDEFQSNHKKRPCAGGCKASEDTVEGQPTGVPAEMAGGCPSLSVGLACENPNGRHTWDEGEAVDD